MAIEQKGKKWGYRVYRAGRRYKKYGFSTRGEAKAAERAFLVELDTKPPIPRNALITIVSQYLVESAMKGRPNGESMLFAGTFKNSSCHFSVKPR
jgi:Arm DNA-binding domain